MTPKEKAKDLYNKFRNENSVMTANVKAKKQAIIAVEEIIKSEPNIPMFSDKYNIRTKSYKSITAFEYWQEVKRELELL